MVLRGAAHLYPFDVVSNERVADDIYKVVIHARGMQEIADDTLGFVKEDFDNELKGANKGIL